MASMAKWIHDRDRRHFEAEGYMIIRGVIPAALVTNAVRDVAAFVGADLADPGTWYNGPAELDGVVPMHHAQSLWDIRQHPNLYELFSEFFGTGQLMLDINRCIFRPPVHPGHPGRGEGDIHWDADPRSAAEASVQAGVMLTPIRPGTGGFQCIPDIYRNIDEWLDCNARDPGFCFTEPGLKQHATVQVSADAGDVILWSTKLPHGSASNWANRPRIAMFVTLTPPPDSQEHRDTMRNLWLTKRAPECWRGLPSQFDPEPGPPAVLTELGQKLLGVIPW